MRLVDARVQQHALPIRLLLRHVGASILVGFILQVAIEVVRDRGERIDVRHILRRWLELGGRLELGGDVLRRLLGGDVLRRRLELGDSREGIRN